jgi:membrane-associated protein
MILSDIFANADMNLFQLAWDIVTNLQQYVVWWVQQIGSGNVTAILCLIIFCETGLVVMPWLPGDSLLFVAGSLCAAAGGSQLSFPLLAILLPVAAILGDNLNYWIGRYAGPKVFKKKKSFFFNADILVRTQSFYEKHGGKMVLLARFVPLVRTFAPFVAGVGKMDYRKFFSYGVVGAFLWVVVCAGAGMLFGNIPWVKDHFEIIVLAVIGISIAPAIFAWMQARAEMKREQRAAAGANAGSDV